MLTLKGKFNDLYFSFRLTYLPLTSSLFLQLISWKWNINVEWRFLKNDIYNITMHCSNNIMKRKKTPMDGCILVGTEKSLPHVVFLYILSDKVQLGAGGLEGWHQTRVPQHFPVIRERVRLDCSAGQEPTQSTRKISGKTFDGFSPPFVYFMNSSKKRLFDLNWYLILDNLSVHLHNLKDWTPPVFPWAPP